MSESSLIKENNNSLITKIRSIFEMKMNTNVNIQGIVLTLTKDLLSDSYKTADIAAFYLDQLVLRILDTEVIFFLVLFIYYLDKNYFLMAYLLRKLCD